MTVKAIARKLVQPLAIQTLLLKERLKTGVSFNIIAPSVRSDPYPAYRRLLSRDPAHWSELMHCWVLTRYADVAAALRDPRLAADRNEALREWRGRALDEMGPYHRLFSRTMLTMDPPDHTRLRGLVNKAFTPRSVEALRPRIHEIVDGLLDEAIPRGEFDIVRDLADLLPVIVIAELLGVPAAEREQFKQWSDDLAEGLEPMLTPTTIERANRSATAVVGYFREIVQERRWHPREDLVSALVVAEREGERLSEDELISTLVLLLAAGNETTTNLIGDGMLTLLRHPDQLRRLRQDPELIEPAVEELLRYDSPVQLTGRLALADMKIGGKSIRRGQLLILIMGAANRDPQQFSDPDRLDFSRGVNQHLGFGLGIHYCLGAPLARLEAQVAINALAQRLPGIRLAGKPRWRPTFVLRGLESLPVAFDRA